MKLFIFGLTIVFAILMILSASCCRKLNNKSKTDIKIVDDYTIIETIKLLDINIFKRENQLFVVRLSIGDSCKYIQFLCKNNDDGNIYFKVKSNWVSLDSISYYSEQQLKECIKTNIEYCISIVENFQFLEINSSCDNKGIRFLTNDSLVLYNIVDEKLEAEFVTDSNYIRIDKNWWISNSKK